MLNPASISGSADYQAISELKTKLKSLNVENVGELKVSVDEAKKATANNNLDELFVSYKGKDYVAYGKGIKMDKLQDSYMGFWGLMPTGTKVVFHDEFNGVKITDRSNESNSFKEGKTGCIEKVQDNKPLHYSVMGGGALAGGYVGFKAGWLPGAVMGAMVGSLAGAVVEFSGAAVVYGIKGASVKPDYASITNITK
jgi:hypothetical protein